MKIKQGYRYGLNRYFLLIVVLSFLGWCFETSYVFIRFHTWYDSGFMSLPFCPIYGFTLTTVYWVIGTPNQPRGIMREIPSVLLRYVLYFAVAFLFPTVMEYGIGAMFRENLHVWLWSYRGMPYNLNGYVCLPISLIWAGLIFVVMRFLFLPLKNIVGKIPNKTAWGLAVVFAIVFLLDTTFNVYKILAKTG